MIEDENTEITEDDLNDFLSAKSDEDRMKILLAHAERNQKIIQIRRVKNMENNQVGSAVGYDEISDQFEEFCRTKGIKAKFRLAFQQMSENAHKQHEQDKATFEARKAQSAEDNKEFVEFLHTKGFKAKCRLVIENIKRGARESKEKTRKQIAATHARTQASINTHSGHSAPVDYTAEQLSAEFNAFLKEKGLDDKYVVEVTEE